MVTLQLVIPFCEIHVRMGLDRYGMRRNLRCDGQPSPIEIAFARANESKSLRGVLGICSQFPRFLVIRHY